MALTADAIIACVTRRVGQGQRGLRHYVRLV